MDGGWACTGWTTRASHLHKAGVHIPISQTGKLRLPSLPKAQSSEEGAHIQTKVCLGQFCFLNTELAAFLCPEPVPSASLVDSTSGQRCLGVGQEAERPHTWGKCPAALTRVSCLDVPGTAALWLQGWTPLISGNNSSEAEQGSEAPRTWAPPSGPRPQQANSAHSWSLAGHLLAGLSLTRLPRCGRCGAGPWPPGGLPYSGGLTPLGSSLRLP